MILLVSQSALEALVLDEVTRWMGFGVNFNLLSHRDIRAFTNSSRAIHIGVHHSVSINHESRLLEVSFLITIILLLYFLS